mmetsp:Transcript_178392/g.565971  ORF Transcript_178392/g.565971 Transcript_178392/m.565971 type:complete len:438 (+) Transcript_178392:63-1376(+)
MHAPGLIPARLHLCPRPDVHVPGHLGLARDGEAARSQRAFTLVLPIDERMTDLVHLVLHFVVNVVEVPRHAFALQLRVVFVQGLHALQLHASSLGLHAVEVFQVVLKPNVGQPVVVCNHLVNLYRVWPVFRVAEEVANAGARHDLDKAAAAPDLHGQLEVVASPLQHAHVKQAEIEEPLPFDGKDASGGSRREVRLRAFSRCVPRAARHQVHVPLVPPNDRRCSVVGVPILLRDDVQRRHRQSLGIQHNPVKQRLQPILVHDAMALHEDDDGALGLLNASHFRPDEALPRRQRDDLNLGGKRHQLLFLGVRVAVGDENVLLDQVVGGEVQERLHGTSQMHPLLLQPGQDDGDLEVFELRLVVLLRATFRPRVRREGEWHVDLSLLLFLGVFSQHTPAPTPRAVSVAPGLAVALRAASAGVSRVSSAVHLGSAPLRRP